MQSSLELMWDNHRDYLRRMLIGLTRDIDLAEDLLQETYINASTGISGYRGGDGRAWLAAIAKNAFYSYSRRRYVRSETPLDVDSCISDFQPDTIGHLELLDLRKAISDLSPKMRTALLLKHYAGFNYSEIGERVGCPEGTAKRRVWQAIRLLRMSLTETKGERAEVKCEQIRGTRLLDYIYGVLPDKESKKVEKHLKECPECREEAEEVKKVAAALDAVEGDYKVTRIIDIGQNGVPAEYSWWSTINNSDEPSEIHWWTINKDHVLDYVMYQGQEWKLEILPATDKQYVYETTLPKPVMPGETTDCVMVMHSTNPEEHASYIREDNWRYFFRTTPNSSREWVQMLAINLPAGAELISAIPEPTRLKTSGNTTVIWHSLLSPVEQRSDGSWPWQFECTVEYHLEGSSAPQLPKEEQSRYESPAVVWAPETLFKAREKMDGGDVSETALELYNQAKAADYPYPRSWFAIGYLLYNEENYQEAMDAFDRAQVRAPGRSPWSQTYGLINFTALAWQGHIYDILGEREKALEKYNAALVCEPEVVGTGWLNPNYCGLKIDRSWVEERLETPFVRE